MLNKVQFMKFCYGLFENKDETKEKPQGLRVKNPILRILVQTDKELNRNMKEHTLRSKNTARC